MQKLIIKKLGVSTVYKIVFVGFSCILVPFFFICGVLAMFGQATLKWNENLLFGINALVAGPFMGFFAAIAMTLMVGSVMALGLWVFSRFRSLEIDIEPVVEKTGNGRADFRGQIAGNHDSTG